MFAAPAEGILKDFMEFAETGCGDHEQAPPNQRTHATEHYAKLINRYRRYGRFRHASSLPKPTRTPSNLTPRNLPLSKRSDTRFSSAVPFQPAWKEPSRPNADHRRLTCKSCRPVKSFVIPAAKPSRSDRTVVGHGQLGNVATPFRETRPNVHRSFLAQMNAHPRRSATDSLCLDPAQAARPDRRCAGVALPWSAL